MKPPNHKYLFITKSHTLLFISLQRYFNYILNQKLIPFSATDSNASQNILFVYREEKENHELLNIVANSSNLKVIVIGYDNDSSVNLIDFANLKANFSKVISQIELYDKELFSEDELRQKLKNFFHSHGEDSLFEYLNWTIYYLRQGPILLITKDISYQDYQEKFLEIGLKNWNLFKNRYLKYKYFIKLSNFAPKFNDLDNTISDADNYVSRLKKMSKEEILEKNKKFFLENVTILIKIDYFLTVIFKEIQPGKYN